MCNFEMSKHLSPLRNWDEQDGSRGADMRKHAGKIALLVALCMSVAACAAQTTTIHRHAATTPTTVVSADTPTPDIGWVTARSEQPADVLATAMSTTMYRLEVDDHGARVISRLATPVLVLPYGAHTGVASYDDAHFIIRTYDSANHPSGQFDFLYDRANHRLAFSSFGVASPGDPYYARPFPPLVTESEAISALQTKRGVVLRVGSTPELIVFPPDPRISPPNPTVTWSGGGYDPSLPMWMLAGADGVTYFVGINQGVYTAKDLPIDPHQGAR
jgi:hypothetical protein